MSELEQLPVSMSLTTPYSSHSLSMYVHTVWTYIHYPVSSTVLWHPGIILSLGLLSTQALWSRNLDSYSLALGTSIFTTLICFHCSFCDWNIKKKTRLDLLLTYGTDYSSPFQTSVT